MIDECKLSHFDEDGKAIMVDVSEKKDTVRVAVARGKVEMSKKTSGLVPMCHPLMITGSRVEFKINREKSEIEIEATVKTTGGKNGTFIYER